MTSRFLVGALVALAACLSSQLALAQAVGQFSDQRDIGNPKLPGSATYDPASGAYRVVGGGGNMWTDHDAFHFVWKKVPAGDIAMSTELAFKSPAPAPNAPGYVHRKGGLIIRQDLDPDSAYVDALRMGNQQLSLQYREVKGGQTRLIWVNTPYQDKLRLERIGDYVYLSVPGPDGKLHHAGGSFKIKLTGPYLVGLGVCAHDDNAAETMEFKNVKIEAIAPQRAKPVLESTIQTIDMRTPAEQTAIYNAVGPLASPTWSSDGKAIIASSRGALYRVALEGAAPVKIASGAVKTRNTDRDISPDGQWAYYQAPASGGMKLWRVHPDGSGKMQITTNADTRDWFAHLSPDGKWIVYLSTGAELPANKIPPNADVELRLMPVVNGMPQTDKITILSKFVGGEGSINAPNWSPDSRTVAFVSYRLARE
jgi:TolB protein